jgi:ABC-type multidrug transport system fused ATPase/permease subunit
LINKLFVLCANRPTQREDLLQNLALLEPYTDLTEYYEAGCPAMRHSPTYRDAYHPAYRVMDEDCVRLLPLLDALDKAPKPLTIAIDGMAGAGKTTLASLLSQIFNCAVIHMDDFFLPFEMRTPQRLAQPGGNVHYE